MNSLQVVSAVGLLLLLEVGGQEIASGKCSDYNVHIVQDFDASKYLGLWYEQARYEAIFQYDMDCVRANYTALNEGRIKVVNSGIVLRSNTVSSVEGVARFVDPSKKEGRMVVKFATSPEGSYWVIGTDYENYSVVLSCTDIMPGLVSANMQFLWILSRTPELPADKKREVMKVVEDANLDTSQLRTTIQYNCSWGDNI